VAAVLSATGLLVVTLLPVGVAGGSPAAETATPDAGQVRVTAAAYVPDASRLGRTGWTARSSTADPGHGASAALDGDAFTYWEAPLTSPDGTGASITLDLGRARAVSGLVYEPRQGPEPEGAVGRFEVSVSTDGVDFTTVSSGTWADTTDVEQVGLALVTTRFVRLTALTAAGGAEGDVAAAELYLEGTPHTAARLDAARTSRTSRTARAAGNPARVGEWGPTIGFPLIPVAVALLPHDQLLMWSADQDLAYGGSADAYTQTAILNLTTGVVSPETVVDTDHNMFCPGVAILANGDVMVTGGLSDQKTSIYDPATNAWTAGPPMNIGRGYNGMTLLSNGQAFTLGGSWSGAPGDKLGEVWSASGGWRELTGVPATPMYTQDAQGAYRADNHGWFIATSAGTVLQAGPSKQMNWITTTGSGTITPAGRRGTSGDAMNGNAVYYDTDKVVTMGGSPSYQNSPATNAAYELTLGTRTTGKGGTTHTVTVKQVGSMAYDRAFANSVVLPNGEVVTVGGQSYAVPFSDANSILTPELWHPGTGTFSALAPEAEPRNYHSSAVLLPDGTVFSGGGGLCGPCSTNHPDGQIFTPPYLLNANGTLKARPTITSAPSTAATGQTITVTTGQPVTGFSLVRYGESTHSTDNDQRRIPLPIVSSTGTTYRLAIPSDPGIALPGPYMLFAMNAAGTPSVSTTVTVTTPGPSAPADAYGAAVFADAPALLWPLGDRSGTVAADQSGNGDTAVETATGVTHGVASPVEGPAGAGVTLDGSTGEISASQPVTDPSTYTETVWFRTTTHTGGLLMGFGSSPVGTSTSRDRLVFMTDSGQLTFGIFAGTPVTVESPRAYNDGAWHDMVATDGAHGIALYVDGQLVADNPTAGPPQGYLGYWRLGEDELAGWANSPSSNYFAGSLSDAAVFGSELTAAQVAALYRSSPAS
jgi:galactose oxidase